MREGTTEQDAELYRTRNRQLVAYATSLTGSPHTAEDLVAVAHFRLWRQRHAGHEVDDAATYLVTTVRALAAERADESADESTGANKQRASHVELLTHLLKQLPERWVDALWYAEVEDLPMEEVGTRIGADANGAAALVSRAHARLHQAFLLGQPGTPADETCAERWKAMPSVLRGTATERRKKQVAEHTEGCDDCRARMLALAEADTRLPALLGPALFAGALATSRPTLAPASGVVAVRSTSAVVARTGSRAGVARHARAKSGILSTGHGRGLMKSVSSGKGAVVGSVGLVGVAAAAFAFGVSGPHHATATAAAKPAATTVSQASGSPAAAGTTATPDGTAAAISSTTAIPAPASSTAGTTGAPQTQAAPQTQTTETSPATESEAQSQSRPATTDPTTTDGSAPTDSPTLTQSPSTTPTPTLSATLTPTLAPTLTPTLTPTDSPTTTATESPSSTTSTSTSTSASASASATDSPSSTATTSPDATVTPTATPTN